MSERLAQSLLLGALILLPVRYVQAETPEDPIYIKTSNGWNAAYAHGNEYAEFRVIGNSAKLQDPYHILLQKNVGMMVSLVDKKELSFTSQKGCRSVGKRIGQLVQTCASKPKCRRNEAAVIGSQGAALNNHQK